MSWNKYKATKVEMAGRSFASKLEAAVFQILMFREKAGEIKDIQQQDVIYLSAAEIKYVPDFKCFDIKNNRDLWVEAKGYEAPRWPTIKKLYRFYGPGPLEIWMGSWQYPKLDEIIIPKSDRSS